LIFLQKVDSSQTEHFRNLLTISKAMKIDQVQNWYEDIVYIEDEYELISRDMDDFYVPFGRMINFKTRKGNINLLSDVFDDAKERATEGLDRFLIRKSGIDHVKVSEVIGKAYLILTDFSRPRRMDYMFSWNEISSKDGIAFLLLYCHARLCR
jgi:arginyl-tRNA synthetase